jgi:hypothetical protein
MKERSAWAIVASRAPRLALGLRTVSAIALGVYRSPTVLIISL